MLVKYIVFKFMQVCMNNMKKNILNIKDKKINL